MLLAAWDFNTKSMVRAHECRREYRDVLQHYANPASDFDAAELIFGELLGNVVRHAPGRVTIRLEWTGAFPILTVHDEDEAFAPVFALPADLFGESGRGLFIIKQLAVSLDVEDVPDDGTKVIVQLPVFGYRAAG